MWFQPDLRRFVWDGILVLMMTTWSSDRDAQICSTPGKITTKIALPDSSPVFHWGAAPQLTVRQCRGRACGLEEVGTVDPLLHTGRLGGMSHHHSSVQFLSLSSILAVHLGFCLFLHHQAYSRTTDSEISFFSHFISSNWNIFLLCPTYTTC